MPIVQLRTQSALNLVSASVSATSLEMQSAGARGTLCAAAVRLEEEVTQGAVRTPIVLPLIPSVLSLDSASAAAMRQEMRSVGGEETLCAVDPWLGNVSPLNICQALVWDAVQLSCVSQSYKSWMRFHFRAGNNLNLNKFILHGFLIIRPIKLFHSQFHP